eukprot:g225.t1
MADVIKKQLEEGWVSAPLGALAEWSKVGRPGHGIVARYLDLHEAAVPHLVDEVRGLAVGSGQPFKKLVLLNLLPELLNEANMTGASVRALKGCSDFHLMSHQQGSTPSGVQAWGHNEDGKLSAADLNYFVHAKITDPGHAAEYKAFTYAGALSGWAWGWNAQGVALSVNALFVEPKPGHVGGVGSFFTARSVYDAVDMDTAIKAASAPGQAGGQHFNLGYMYANCTAADPCQVSVESSPHGASVQILSADPLLPGAASPPLRPDWYAHFNQYVRLPDPGIGDITSSIHRMARAATLAVGPDPPRTARDIATRILADSRDKTFSLRRGNTAQDPDVTYTTTVFDLSTKRAIIFAGDPEKPMPTQPLATMDMTAFA